MNKIIKMIQHLMAAVATRQVMISDQNQGPAVNLAAWIGLTMTVLFVFVRIGSKWSVVRKWTLDDTLIITTMLITIAYTVAISTMVANGLGQPQSRLVSEDIEDFQRAGYASQLLYVPALCLAKLSILIYLRALSPDTPFAILNRILEVFIVIWGISTEFALAFQCRLPNPWTVISGRCFNMIPFWNTTGGLDILTDLAIIALPAYLVWGIHMPLRKKGLVFLIFGTRIFITPLTVLRLYYLNTISSPTRPNQTFASYHAYLSTTIQLNLAIVVACLPFMKPFMENLSTGGFTTTVDPMDSSFAPIQGGSNIGSLKFSFSTFVSSQSKPSRRGSKQSTIPMDSIFSPTQTVSTDAPFFLSSPAIEDFNFEFVQRPQTSGKSQAELGPLRPDRVTSYSHIRRSTPEQSSASSSIASGEMIIKKKTEWDVREDYEPHALYPAPPIPAKHQGRFAHMRGD